jgi:hypothetical protein
MKNYNKSVFNATIVILIFILNIKNIKGASGKCDGCNYIYTNNKCMKDGNACPSYCRPHYYESTCYDCSEVFKNDKRQFYSISNNKCIEKIADPLTSDDSKIFINSDTNEIVSSDIFTADNPYTNIKFYQFGQFLYKNCPADTQAHETSKTICVCNNNDKKYIYKDKIFNRLYFKCVSSCPFGYHVYENERGEYKCMDDCNTFDRIIASNNSCSSSCPSDQNYIYTYQEKIYCSNKCPSSAPFYYNTENERGEIECIEKCNDKDFYYQNTKVCVQKCDNYKLLVDIKNSIYICYKPKTDNPSCPDNFPYEYGDLCLRKCSDTNEGIISDTTHFNSGLKKKHIASLLVVEQRNVLKIVILWIVTKNIMMKRQLHALMIALKLQKNI